MRRTIMLLVTDNLVRLPMKLLVAGSAMMVLMLAFSGAALGEEAFLDPQIKGGCPRLPAEDGYGGFVLILVLFILLVIIGGGFGCIPGRP
ncbi:MAG: YjcZ family sporulation protein [Rubrobacteraceae bacterium]